MDKSFVEKLLERRGFTGEPHWNLEEIVSMSRGLEAEQKIGSSSRKDPQSNVPGRMLKK